jgi:hypothetical protein
MTDYINFQFSCGNDKSSGLISILVSFVNVAGKQMNIFSLYKYNQEKQQLEKKYQKILKSMQICAKKQFLIQI